MSLRGWILGFGPKVVVRGPPELVSEMKGKLEKAAALYAEPAGSGLEATEADPV